MKKERKEALMRIPIGIVSILILGVWKAFVQILAIVNWFIVLITEKRNRELANLCEMWNTQMYNFLKYMTFVTNKRPFPFTPLEKNMTKFER